MENIDTFYGHLEYFVVIWYIFPVLVCLSKKHLATLVKTLGPKLQIKYMVHLKTEKKKRRPLAPS
jgi:hypothetical protein